MEFVIICLVTLIGGGGAMVTLEHFFGPKAIPTKYDPHYTRKQEVLAFGQARTVCTNLDCKECYKHEIELPKPKAPPKPKLVKCSTCKVPLDEDGWCSNGCVKKTWVSYTPKRGELVYDPNMLLYRCYTCGMKYSDETIGYDNLRTCVECKRQDSWKSDPRHKGYRPQDIDFQIKIRAMQREAERIQADFIEIHSDQSAKPINIVRTNPGYA